MHGALEPAIVRIRGAKALVFDPDQNVLVLRRSKTHPHVPLSQDLPGGNIEEGESMVEGLLRELHEEIGLVLQPAELAKCVEATIDDHYGKNYYLELYSVSLDERPDIVLDFEHDQFEWLPLHKVQLIAKDRYNDLIAQHIAQSMN